MRAVYIGFAIAIVLIVIAFAVLRYKQGRDFADAIATPTPGPNASQKPIALTDQSVGKPAFAPGDNKGGGAGGPVDAIQCETTEQVTMHIHSHLALFVKGKQIQIPQYVGIVPTGNTTACLYWIHTHDPTGIIHVEAPEIHQYTLGNFFDIWGEDLKRDEVGPYYGPVTAFVNGAKYDGDLAQIPLRAHQQITLEVGAPIVPAPYYSFPNGL
ncbi:MAG: hypothetical protein JO233_07085 [Candidatus Eremiobacteraeota bacterium]|nr:hypothetical protein [Candidatus Eremiobacteraeota bacterium]